MVARRFPSKRELFSALRTLFVACSVLMDDSDLETPRTLLSAVLKRNKPQPTIRQQVRRTPRRLCRAVSSDSPIEPHIKSISSSPVDKKTSAKVSDATPRGLVNEILSKHNITKTLRVTVRQIHPDILTKKYIQEPSDVIPRQENHDRVQVMSNVPREEQNDAPKATENEPLHGLQGKTSSPPLTEHGHEQELSERQASHQTPATSTNIQDLSKNQNFKQRVKRMRLSDIKFSAEKSELDSFTNDLVDRVKALVKNKEKQFVSERKISTLSSTRMHNQSVSSRPVSRVDASSNTEAQEDVGNCNSSEATIPPSDVDVSSDLGPLELSRITEDDSKRFDGENSSYFLSTARSTGQRVSDTERELVQIQTATLNNNSQEVLVQHHNSHNRDSDILANSEPMHEDEDPNVECQERPDNEVLQLPQTVSAKEKVDTLPKEAAPVLRSSSTKKYRARRRKPTPNNLPFTSRQLSGIVKHYSNRRFTKPALTAFEEASRRYFTETAKHLERICRERELSSITSDIVEYLMKRRQTVTRKKDLHVLIEENLPMEYREELIPIAISGNVVLPEKVTG